MITSMQNKTVKELLKLKKIEYIRLLYLYPDEIGSNQS